MKDFTIWHQVKRAVEKGKKGPLFRSREIWMCHVGENVGHEQDGKGDTFLRPVLIFRKFNQSIFWGIPLSKTIKPQKSPFFFEFVYKEDILSRALLSQLKLMDAKRLLYRSGKIKYKDYLKLKEALKDIIESF